MMRLIDGRQISLKGTGQSTSSGLQNINGTKKKNKPLNLKIHNSVGSCENIPAQRSPLLSERSLRSFFVGHPPFLPSTPPVHTDGTFSTNQPQGNTKLSEMNCFVASWNNRSDEDCWAAEREAFLDRLSLQHDGRQKWRTYWYCVYATAQAVCLCRSRHLLGPAHFQGARVPFRSQALFSHLSINGRQPWLAGLTGVSSVKGEEGNA
ncbi:hypothetical protein JD844_014926 [Phrynosoma platyrhinos]|uniref:Uncharacterized protein n=1 Tax=Phrynosoma platyrhinos TaxID=52577 RepID=A0ABQ7T7K8_PHRPL|nr:hypothetical protein JD844_014926 [Phrynosoma platyrhinos]